MNTKLNGYKAFYRGQSIEVYAETSFAAQQQAAAKFKARKSWQVTVVLCERGTDGTAPGEQVFHTPA